MFSAVRFVDKSYNTIVNNLSKNITIILIAHRINTLKKCDVIFKLENSRLIGQGSYDKILRDNSNSLI